MFSACFCCKKKTPKNELLGLEGMVKLKNPDDIVIEHTMDNGGSQAELNVSTVSNADSEKRASTAAHRSLPDIPASDVNGDYGSEIYETVADKRLMTNENQPDKSPTRSLRKQASLSQHSSISQADDISSPYSRVKNSPHDYAKVRSTEHPYAQLKTPSSSTAAANTSGASTSAAAVNVEPSNRNSQGNESTRSTLDGAAHVEIAAAPAIAGMISASQDLPYMTPPITNQHFSGDSQDSSKGYTSISVREPLANILAQQPIKPAVVNRQMLRDLNDSHYATVSDDSDETYAAIEDPNGRLNAGDIYTSGSETYAQIQPMQAASSIVVSVEINNTSTSTQFTVAPPTTGTSSSSILLQQEHSSSTTIQLTRPVDSLRAQVHSRQASSASNNSSSVGNLGSPKPEKRQANSPLPPTPKSNATGHQSLHPTNSNNLTSGRNSVVSVLDFSGVDVNVAMSNVNTTNTSATETSPPKKTTLSPTKDIEGMYAKVMKKHKLSHNAFGSPNSSPILMRKFGGDQTATSAVQTLEAETVQLLPTQNVTIENSMPDKNRARSNSYGAKDHGYETIPGDAARSTPSAENRKSDCYANVLQRERLQEIAHPTTWLPKRTQTNIQPPIIHLYESEKHYETIKSNRNTDDDDDATLLKNRLQVELDVEKKSDYDPNYEVLKHSSHSPALSDAGYAKVGEKSIARMPNDDDDSVDGYSKVKPPPISDNTIDGYSTIGEAKEVNHNYASILETRNAQENDLDHYSRILDAFAQTPTIISPASLTSPSSTSSSLFQHSSGASSSINVASTTSSSVSTSNISSHLQTPTTTASWNAQYESLTGSDTDPNYESLNYFKANQENPYKRLQSDTRLTSPVTPEEVTSTMPVTVKNNTKIRNKSPDTGSDVVDDYFQV